VAGSDDAGEIDPGDGAVELMDRLDLVRKAEIVDCDVETRCGRARPRPSNVVSAAL
jgi:hypothetical protein